MYKCESWAVRKAECQRINAFELLCWGRLLIVPWTARKSNLSILKEITMSIHWKDWCWSWNSNTLATWCKELTHSKKTLMLGKIEVRRRKGQQGMRWLDGIRLDGHEFEQAPAIGDGQGSLVCCSPWNHKESDTTEQLNWTVLKESTQTTDEASSPSSKIYFRRRW